MSTSKLAPLQVGVLSSLSAPLLPHLLQTLFHYGITGVCVLLDSKNMNEKDLGIWNRRTEGAFDHGPNLHDFTTEGLTLYAVKSHNDESSIELIKKIRLKLLINGGTLRKLNSDVLSSVSQGVINVHPGVLPKYRGSSCVEWAIYNDDPIGNTAHFMSEGYDEGPIIKTEHYEFTKGDSYSSIRVRVYRESLRLMAETVKYVLDSGLRPADIPKQGDGQLFPPIPNDKMEEVIKKIDKKLYVYMQGNNK